MVQRVLIANRGEIALRIQRACHVLGKETVAVHTAVDQDLPHLAHAADQVRIRHYLNIDDVVMAAKTTNCDAVHPGYGLLSENADFAASVESAGLVFIGPTPGHIAQLGDKVEARRVFSALGVPVIPGSDGAVTDFQGAVEVAERIGYPIVVKAAFGGGGRGIRSVSDESELRRVLDLSRGEAGASFGRDEIFIEKLITGARHVELQFLGDGLGGCVHLGSRDCSIQRRYQKLIEEAPAPKLDQGALDDLINKCSAALSKLKYRNAATLEFLYVDAAFYFLEVNTRLQVEHPVTEMISGQDVVAAQIDIAEHQKLPFQQPEVALQGHAIECRILAEDEGGLPSPGVVSQLKLPGGPGVRVDTHLFVGYQVPHQYDSMIAKLIASGTNRDHALARLRQALAELKITGVKTNVDALREILDHPEFTAVSFSTQWKPS